MSWMARRARRRGWTARLLSLLAVAALGALALLRPGTGSAAPAPTRKVEKDPVCGMTVDPAKAASSAEYDRKLYHFCSRNCGEKFRKDPARYLTTANKPAGMTGMVQVGGAPVQIGVTRRLEKDLVCGMNVDPSAAAATVNP